MKKFFYMLMATMGIGVAAHAANGDTTWVQAQNNAWLGTVPTNTDTTIQFPDGSKSYRKIYMIFTLGKYACPGNPQYCADWDYTVQNFLMTPNGDTVELGRLITPYANSSRMTATWKGNYIYDVTDMYPLLKDSATVRTHFSGWSGGFTGTIRFAFIEGTPPRNVLGIERLWNGSFKYGDAADPIDNSVTAISKTAPANTQSTEMKLNITGHGADGTENCSEFCKKYYQVLVNGSVLEQKDIWRDNCGSNNYYPQNGTWVFDRANWCPGDLVHTNTHKLNVTGNNAYSVDLDFENYTGSGTLGSYTLEGAVYYYGGFNRSLDASLEDVIAPNNHEMYFRKNPGTANPVVKVKNTGSATITSIAFVYSVNGASAAYYTWQGSLSPLAEAEVTLPEIWELRTVSGNANTFACEISQVNGQADEDNTNNKVQTTFTAAPQWPNQMLITLKTNGSSVTSGASETSWRLYQNDVVVKERVNLNPSTTYVDTVRLGPGAYKLEVTDAGCDGVNWWLYPNYPQNPGAGSITVKKLGNVTNMPLSGYYNGDFGCGFTQYFNVNWPTDVEDINTDNKGIELYPNPANQSVNVSLLGIGQVNGTIQVIDAIGRVVINNAVQQASETINTSMLASGVYSVVYSDASGIKLQSRLVIAK